MSIDTYQQGVSDLVRDKDQVVDALAIDAAIASAVERYSGLRARRAVEDLTVPAGSELPLPTGWIEGFSEVLAVEYPVDASPISELEIGLVRLRLRPAGYTIEVPATFVGGETVRLTYKSQHVLDLTSDTIPAHHRFAVQCLAASIVCGQLSAYYATEGAPTIGADAADHQGKTERYRNRARDLLAEFNKTLGVTDARTGGGADSQVPPAGAVTSVEIGNNDGSGRLFHGRRYF